MTNICSCGDTCSEKPEIIRFSHKSFKLRTLRSGNQCVKCAKKEHIKQFEKVMEIEGLITKKGDCIKVNWTIFLKNHEKDRIGNILISLNILSYKAERNWEIVAEGPIGFNPRVHTTYLYFTHEKDAIDFAHSQLGENVHTIDVHHIDKVIIFKREE